MENKAITM